MHLYAEKRLQEQKEVKELVEQVLEGHKNVKQVKAKIQEYKQQIGICIDRKMTGDAKYPQITSSFFQWVNYNFYRKESVIEGKIQAVCSHECMNINSGISWYVNG